MKKKFITILTILMVLSLASIGWAVVNNQPTAVITTNPSSNFTITDPISIDHFNSSDPDSDAITAVQWDIKMRVQDAKGAWSDWTQKSFTVGEITTTIPASADGYSYHQDYGIPSEFYGSEGQLVIGYGVDYLYFPHIKFDLSSLPTNATIVSAEIITSATSFPTSTIGKNTSDWNDSSTSVPGMPFTDHGTFPYIDASLVQGWLDGSIPNYGIYIDPQPYNTPDLWFDSKEQGATGPRLKVKYTLPS